MSERLNNRPGSALRFSGDDPVEAKPGRKKRLQQRRGADALRRSGKPEAALQQAPPPQPGAAPLHGQLPHRPGKQKSGPSMQGTEAGQLPAKITKHRYYDAANGVTTTRLRIAQAKKPARLMFNSAAAPARFTRNKVNDRLREYDGDNSGVAALHGAEAAEETSAKYAHTKIQKHRNRTAKRKRRSEVVSDIAPQFHSNPISRRIQKHKLHQSYMQAHAGRAVNSAAGPVTQVRSIAAKAKEAAKSMGKTIVRKTGKAAVLFLAIGGTVSMLMTSLVSCGGVAGSGAGGAAELGAYAAEEEDILAAEEVYCQMEADLQAQLDSYEADHDYDEYHFELDEIGHDPYVLISLVSSIHEGPWTIEEVRPTLEQIFARQYTLTEEVVVEAIEIDAPDPSTNPTEPEPTQPPSPPRPPGPTPQPQAHDEEDATDDDPSPSTRKICTVTLDNFNLSHLPVYMLNESQLAHYSVYMASLGCRPDLFPNSEYVGRYGTGSYTDYAISTEALEDEVFAAMMAEARKYLGYPYVWGGSSPSTSFDCSGYVSWVINHTIVNGQPVWGNIGRRGVTGIYQLCTPTSTPHPGDLVFFTGTYDTDGFSHIGIYVGEHMMLHCGDPISFTDLNSSYWQEHLYGYGKLP